MNRRTPLDCCTAFSASLTESAVVRRNDDEGEEKRDDTKHDRYGQLVEILPLGNSSYKQQESQDNQAIPGVRSKPLFYFGTRALHILLPQAS